MLQSALKEWAALCLALGRGLQCLLLRKGGIREPGPGFEIPQRQFWLMPTYLHQAREGLARAAWPLIEQADLHRPTAGQFVLQYFAEVADSYRLDSLEQVERLETYHLLAPATAAQRYAYRQPGLTAIVLRVWELQKPHVLPNAVAYDGCKSWVTLEQPLASAGAVLVLSEKTFAEHQARIRTAIEGGGKP